MANISGCYEEYMKSYEKLSNDNINVSALLMIAETGYDEIQNLVQYKYDSKNRAIDYNKKINIYYSNMLNIFYRLDSASSIYDTYRFLFAKKYLDNTNDDTNDYNDETMIKLNKIYSFIDNNRDKEFKGTELLSNIRREINGFDEVIEDDYFDNSFEMLKNQSDLIRSLSNIDDKKQFISFFLLGIADMEADLFNKKLFYDDYRKSVTGLVDYLLLRAEIPLIYIKPVELDEYYENINKVDGTLESKEDIITFYKEKMSNSMEEAFVEPMKNSIKISTERKLKKYILEPDNGMDRIRME